MGGRNGKWQFLISEVSSDTGLQITASAAQVSAQTRINESSRKKCFHLRWSLRVDRVFIGLHQSTVKHAEVLLCTFVFSSNLSCNAMLCYGVLFCGLLTGSVNPHSWPQEQDHAAGAEMGDWPRWFGSQQSEMTKLWMLEALWCFQSQIPLKTNQKVKYNQRQKQKCRAHSCCLYGMEVINTVPGHFTEPQVEDVVGNKDRKVHYGLAQRWDDP